MTTRSLRSLSSDCIRPAFLPPLDGRAKQEGKRDLERCCLPRLLLGATTRGRCGHLSFARRPASPRDACLPPAPSQHALEGCRQSLRPLKEHKLCISPAVSPREPVDGARSTARRPSSAGSCSSCSPPSSAEGSG